MISGAQPCRPSLWLSSKCVGVTNLPGYGEWAAAASQGDLFSSSGEGTLPKLFSPPELCP